MRLVEIEIPFTHCFGTLRLLLAVFSGYLR